MKKFSLLLLFVISTIATEAQIAIPSPSPLATVSQKVGLTNVSITYSRPSVKGRKIFGNLVPYGKVWRTGANQCSVIKFEDDVEINGRNIKAGSYGLFAIPKEKTWKIILNSDYKQWGAYDFDSTKNVLVFEVIAKKLSQKVEQMTISFQSKSTTSADICIEWEKTMVKIPLEQCIHDQILAEIQTKTNDPNAKLVTFEQAADYYYENNINLPQALAWAQKVLNVEKRYWNYSLVAQIAGKLENCELALPNAQTALELATKEKDDSYILMSKNVIKRCNELKKN